MNKKTVRDMDLKGKRVLMRVDFNVPMQAGKVTDDTRIRASLPTIQYVLEHGASLVLMSHLGRPKAGPDPEFSLKPASQALAGLLGRDYVIPDDIKALAEPALAHRLIIKTSSSIHDVQAGQVVRELLETTSIEGIRPTGTGGPTGLRSPSGAPAVPGA